MVLYVVYFLRGCVMAVHFAYTCIAIYTSLFTTELNVSDKIIGKLQNHSFMAKKYSPKY